MSTLSSFLRTVKVNPNYNERVFVTSQTFVTPFSGRYLVTAIGPGGSGSGTTGNCSSGGAGGLAQSLWKLPAGFSLVLTMGAPGAKVTSAVVGNDGGTTTVTGTGLTTLTANGGKGGTADYTVALAQGGTASGGNVMNVTGGRGGRGGGAVGVYGVSYDGNIICEAGAGTGGPPSTTAPIANLYLSYPGTGVFSGDEAAANNLYYEVYVTPSYPLGGSLLSSFKSGRVLNPNGGFQLGSTGSYDCTGGPGCGSGYGNTSFYGNPSKAGLFAGGSRNANVGLGAVGGALGGGGGAHTNYNYAGAGGCAGVVIEWINDLL